MQKRSLLLACIACIVGSSTPVQEANAQAPWPSRPIRFVVPYPPGGPVDLLARVIAPRLSDKLGQVITVENRGGGGASIGVAYVVKGPTDGTVIGFGTPGAITVLPLLQKLPYTLEEINYVSLVARVPQVIAVSSKLQVNSLPELIKMAKQNPGKLNFGSSGPATTPHLGAELLKKEAGIDMMHVPYSGAAPAVTGLIANDVQVMTSDLPGLLPFEGHGIKILAVSGEKRVDLLPNVPTTAELGLPSVRMESNYGVIAPTGTPAEITQKLHAALVAVLAMPEVRAQIAAQGALASSTTPDEYRKMMQTESATWAEVIKTGNIKLQ